MFPKQSILLLQDLAVDRKQLVNWKNFVSQQKEKKEAYCVRVCAHVIPVWFQGISPSSFCPCRCRRRCWRGSVVGSRCCRVYLLRSPQGSPRETSGRSVQEPDEDKRGQVGRSTIIWIFAAFSYWTQIKRTHKQKSNPSFTSPLPPQRSSLLLWEPEVSVWSRSPSWQPACWPSARW